MLVRETSLEIAGNNRPDHTVVGVLHCGSMAPLEMPKLVHILASDTGTCVGKTMVGCTLHVVPLEQVPSYTLISDGGE
jgi:hypothetical protein